MKKECTKSGLLKPKDQYNKNGKRNGVVRYKGHCKQCEADYKSLLPVFISGKYHKILDRYKRNKRPELQIHMTKEEFIIEINEQLQWSAFRCPITDLPLTHKQDKYTDTNFSIDRIDPKKGYTKDNIMVTSLLWNQMKSNNELQYMIRFCIMMRARQKDLYKKLYKESFDHFFNQSKRSKKFINMIQEFEKDAVEQKI